MHRGPAGAPSKCPFTVRVLRPGTPLGRRRHAGRTGAAPEPGEDAARDVDGTKSVGLLARTVPAAVGAASVHRDSQVPKSPVMPCPTRPRPPSQKTNEPVARVDSLPASST